MTRDYFDLSGSIALLSGGGGFLGRYLAEALGEYGAHVILIDINKEYLKRNTDFLEENGVKTETFVCDVTNEESVFEVVKEIEKRFKKIDIFINALNHKPKTESYFLEFEKYLLSDWTDAIQLHLTGSFLLLQNIGRIMKKNKKGSIVNIASDVGIISPDHRIYKKDVSKDYEGVDFNTPLSYSVSKAGLISASRYLATLWAKDGIRVNSVSPAGVYNNQPEKFVEQLSNLIPLGRMAKPEELKSIVVFLASEASSYITGSNIIIDGGRTAL